MSDVQQYRPKVAELLGEVPGQYLIPPESKQGAMVGGAFDAASRFDRSVALWSPRLQSADDELLPDKRLIDARTRDSLRNDAYVAGGADLHRDNIVGAQYVLNSKPELRVLGLDEKWSAEFQEEVEAKFTLYAESFDNWIDASRMNNFTQLIRLGVGVYVAGGEILASAEWMRDSARPYRTAIQMIDVDRLSNPQGQMDTKYLKAGVAKDNYGAPIGYHIQQAHPYDRVDLDSYRWKYIPARKPWGRVQMIHIMDQLRPGQTRGVTAMVSALKELRITKKFRDVVLQNAVVNATYAASIESDLPSEAVFQALGGGTVEDAVAKYAGGFLNAVTQYSGGARNMHIDGVKIPHLFPGTKLQLRPAGQAGPLGQEFEQSLLRYIAAVLGVSYEQLSRDYSNTNYSSIRAAMTETWKYMQSKKRTVADKLATMIYKLWLEEAINRGDIESLPRNAPSWYEGLNAEAYSACDWIGASRGQVDELKETQAAVLRLKYNLTTVEDEAARLGKDWRKIYSQREREKKEERKRGLLGEGDDNMMNATTGAPREKEAKDEKDDGSEDNTDV